jgi:hypothetical protein
MVVMGHGQMSWLMSEICASVTKGSYPTFLDARLHGHDVIPAQAGI